MPFLHFLSPLTYSPHLTFPTTAPAGPEGGEGAGCSGPQEVQCHQHWHDQTPAPQNNQNSNPQNGLVNHQQRGH